METPVEIIWHNMDPAPHVTARVNHRVERLEKFFDRITRCHVVVEAAHRLGGTETPTQPPCLDHRRVR